MARSTESPSTGRGRADSDSKRSASNGILTQIWSPRIQIVNQQHVFPTMPEVAEIAPNGDVIYRQRVWGTFSQPLKLRDFPFDRQEFSILFTAVGYREGQIELVRVPELTAMAARFSVPD